MNDARGARSTWAEQIQRVGGRSSVSSHEKDECADVSENFRVLYARGEAPFATGFSWKLGASIPSVPPVERDPDLCIYASIDAYSRMDPTLGEVLARLYGPRPTMTAAQFERWKDNAPLVLWLRGTLELPREARAVVLAEINDLRCRAHAAYLQELRA